MFSRYGAPIIVLDLVKQSEKRKRESIIGREFRQAVEVINMNIPDSQKIRYVALDFSRMSKAIKQGNSVAVAAAGAPVASTATGKEWSSFEQSLGTTIIDGGSSGGGPTSPVASAGSGTPLGEDAKGSTNKQKNLGSATGRLDVLKELKNIASWTIHETSFFCR